MDIKTLQTQILSALQQGDIMLANNLMDKILPSMAPTMDEALTISIVGAITGHATTSIAIKAQTIGHFLSVAHDNVPEQAIASAMKDFSQAAKFDGVFNEDAILEAYHAIIYNISDDI